MRESMVVGRGLRSGFSVLTAGMPLLILTGCHPQEKREIGGSLSVRVASAALNETREIFLHLPESYDDSDER